MDSALQIAQNVICPCFRPVFDSLPDRKAFDDPISTPALYMLVKVTQGPSGPLPMT
jgi:hypothetical protein